MYEDAAKRQREIDQERQGEEERYANERDLKREPTAYDLHHGAIQVEGGAYNVQTEIDNYHREGDAMAGNLSPQELTNFMAQREADREAHGLGGYTGRGGLNDTLVREEDHDLGPQYER
jgi:hypothetical protein